MREEKTWLFYLFTVTGTINWYYYSQRPKMEEKEKHFYKAVDKENWNTKNKKGG